MMYTIEHNAKYTKTYYCIDGQAFNSLSELLSQYPAATKKKR